MGHILYSIEDFFVFSHIDYPHPVSVFSQHFRVWVQALRVDQ